MPSRRRLGPRRKPAGAAKFPGLARMSEPVEVLRETPMIPTPDIGGVRSVDQVNHAIEHDNVISRFDWTPSTSIDE